MSSQDTNMFIVICDDPNECIEIQKIAQQTLGADTHKIADTVLLIRYVTENPRVLSDIFGMTGDHDEPRIGLVLKLNGSRSGYYYAPVWEWFEDRERTVSG